MTDPNASSEVARSAARSHLSAQTLAGISGVVGGLIHLLGPLAYGHISEIARQTVWIVIDMLLLLAMLGLQASAGRAMGRLGLSGFVLALGAVLVVRSASADILGPDTYAIASSLWSIGMALIAGALLRKRLPFRAAAMLWIQALAIGLVGLVLQGAPTAHHLAAACFGLGFVSLGVQLIRTQDPAPSVRA